MHARVLNAFLNQGQTADIARFLWNPNSVIPEKCPPVTVRDHDLGGGLSVKDVRPKFRFPVPDLVEFPSPTFVYLRKALTAEFFSPRPVFHTHSYRLHDL